jgi:hypothetical protein
MKTQYRFLHRSEDGLFYFWESKKPVSPNESRHEVIVCPVGVFWNPST